MAQVLVKVIIKEAIAFAFGLAAVLSFTKASFTEDPSVVASASYSSSF